jgi:hypothetical protein
VFRANRKAIEEFARRKYLAGQIEPDGSVPYSPPSIADPFAILSIWASLQCVTSLLESSHDRGGSVAWPHVGGATVDFAQRSSASLRQAGQRQPSPSRGIGPCGSSAHQHWPAGLHITADLHFWHRTSTPPRSIPVIPFLVQNLAMGRRLQSRSSRSSRQSPALPHLP